jgi:RHS repeat-associated protein
VPYKVLAIITMQASSSTTPSQVCAFVYLFTGKERDAESGLDYFGARYYASSMGRWMSPDWADKPEPVPYSSLDNPQSLNLYGYVLNNPLSKDDPDGHCCEWAKQKYAQAQKWAGDHPRTVAAMKATGAAIVTVAAVATIVATAPVSVPVTLGAAAASALTTTAVAITGTGAAVATVAYTGAAITGDQNLSQAADAVQTVTNPVGMAVTIGSGGNLEMGSKAAAVSDLLTGGKDMLSHAEAGASTAAAATQHAGGAATAGAAAATLAPEPKKDEHK